MALGRARSTTTATAVALVAVLAAPFVAGCSGSAAPEPGEPVPSPTGSATAAGGSPTAEPVLDPAHAVDPPGRRTGLISGPDIVANGSTTISPGQVRAIERLPGVVDVEQISLVQVVIENQSLSVAAVDPATYRNYVIRTESAQADDVWERVAGGELAIRPALQKRAPIDEQGFLRLGSAEDAPRVHVGAYAQQSWLVDAVVNETWIPDLEMTEGNALLIRTGSKAPITLRKPIQRILRDASVQMTDAVARYGLDTDAVQTAVVVGTIADAVGTFRYRVLGGGMIAPDPAWVASHIVTQTVPILGRVTCNRLMMPQLEAALRDVQLQGLADEIDPDQYAGCYYPRFIAGSTKLSNHAFGLALDLNTLGNQRGTVGEIDRGVVAIFKRWGFAWGGDWSYTDPMHFEMSRLVEPR
ncbi:MAG TPA: M15 family metallopeptidase [Nocardioides sp.]|nr:M15 family metallopeptidase [Nocardioides sp.]